jgi:hypothetical protein
MRNLVRRLGALEQRMTPAGIKRWLCIFQYAGETKEQAVAAYEAENGGVTDSVGVILRVIVNTLGPPPAHS